MSPPFAGVVTWAHRRRRLVWTGAACLLVLSCLGVRRVTFDTDVLRLLPQSGTAIPAFGTFVDEFGTLDDLFVVFDAPDGYSVTGYEDDVERWVEALRAAPEIARVDSGRVDDTHEWSWLAERELLLFDETTLGDALSRLTPAAIPAALAQSRELLAIPSPEIAAMVRDDPLGLHDLLRRQLRRSQSAVPIGVTGNGYLSADGTRRLVIARPVQPPYDTQFSHALFARLDTIARDASAMRAEEGSEPRPPVRVRFAGGHRIALEAESVVRRESIVNGVGSLVLILPLLFLVFRSMRLVLIGALPSAVGLVMVLGVMGLAGATLSAAAAGASAMLFGLGVDGAVLLYVAHRHAMAEGLEGAAAVRALASPAASMLLGMWTTAATFLGLVVVDFPSLEQLGLLIGLSMIACGALTLFLVPASLPSQPPRRAPRALSMPALATLVQRHAGGVLIAAAVATVVLGYFATTLRVNPTLDRLRSVTEGATFVEEITRAFSLPADAYVVVGRGTDLEALLAANETLVGTLRATAPSLAVQAASGLLPSARTQAVRRRQIQAAVPDVGAVTRALADAAASAGFRPRSFDQFADRLPRMVDPGLAITWDGFAAHKLDDVIARLVTHRDGVWTLASYAFPTTAAEVSALRKAVADAGGDMVLTGLPIVNEELSARFLPQFALGLGVGSAVVVILILITFRNLRLALLTLLPTVIGLLWAAGLLALAGVELDLFAVFAVITFVGIGVDYGVHLVHRYRERGDVSRAIAELAPVILVAGAITLLGYGTLIGSSYPPLRSMGLVSAVSVVTLVLASVLVLPAMLQRIQD